jgi:hypothetical protein
MKLGEGESIPGLEVLSFESGSPRDHTGITCLWLRVAPASGMAGCMSSMKLNSFCGTDLRVRMF